MNVLRAEPRTSLRNALRANATFSTLSGIAFLIAPAYCATHVGIGENGFIFLGANLLGFAIFLVGLSTNWSMQRKWSLWLVGLVVLMDLLWVVGSVVLSSIPSMATDAGKMGILTISVIVGTFAAWQLTALIRSARKNTEATGSSSMLSIGFVVMVLLNGCSPADLRPAALKSEAVNQELIDRGHSILSQAAEAHGYAAWQMYTTQEVELTDTWQAPSWWPADRQSLSFKSLLGTFTARADLLDGVDAGVQLGTQAWIPYQRTPSGTLEMLSATEELTVQNFYIPSLQYFHEFPFRMLQAENIAYAGEEVYRGKTYDLVFVTWGGFGLNAKHDQYVLWIEKDTSLIMMCQYTVRQAGAIFTGTIHFEDYREVQGVFFPFKQTVVLPSPKNTIYPLDDYFFHQSVFSTVAFDSFDAEDLIVDKSQVPADAKPQLE